MNSEGRFSSIPIKALSCSTRTQISLFLNPEETSLSKNMIARDYRGLAELLNFDIVEIRDLSRCEDPTSKILKMWENKLNATVGDFFNFLEQMERGDALQQCLPFIENDVAKYLKMQNPVQAPVVTSCAPVSLNSEDETVSATDRDMRASYIPAELRPSDRHVLSTNDACNGEYNRYNAYICHADEDLEFVFRLVRYLEGACNMKVFLPCRDLVSGHLEQVALVKLIKERCDRMLVILSPAFNKASSNARQFQANFAAALGVENMERKAIPVIIAPCEVPVILEKISKIDFTDRKIPLEWTFNKLHMSIKTVENSAFTSPITKHARHRIENTIPKEAISSIRNDLAIEFPPSSNSFKSSDASALTLESTLSACSSSSVVSFNKAVSELTVRSMPIATTSRQFANDSRNTAATSESSKVSVPKQKSNYLKESFFALKKHFSKSNQSFSQVTSCANDAGVSKEER